MNMAFEYHPIWSPLFKSSNSLNSSWQHWSWGLSPWSQSWWLLSCRCRKNQTPSWAQWPGDGLEMINLESGWLPGLWWVQPPHNSRALSQSWQHKLKLFSKISRGRLTEKYGYYTISFSYAIKIHLKTFGVQINIYIWAENFYDMHQSCFREG